MMRTCLAVCLLPVCLVAACQQAATPSLATREWYRTEGDRLDAAAKNQYKAKSFTDFVNSPTYRGSRDIWRGGAIQLYDPAHSWVEVLVK